MAATFRGFLDVAVGFYVDFLGGRTIFWGETARKFKRFRKAVGGFRSNSVGTRLNEAH